ncbi:MAG: DUF11 domain-containing protein [Dehalococcoidales bacterium]|nr:DUF11 domain-containing protein [Dehalococcoidales bacterium]
MKLRRLISGLLLATLLCIMLPLGVLAEGETTTTTEAPTTTTTTDTPTTTTTTETPTTTTPVIGVEMKTDYPKIEVTSGSQVTFSVNIVYTNTEDTTEKEFDLIVKAPENWTGYVNSSTGARIASINLDPTRTYGANITVYGVPSSYVTPEPGEYTLTLQVTSGDIISSVDLTAKVTAKYGMTLVPAGTTAIYSTSATAGKETVYSITLTNTGSAPIDNVNMSSMAPANWVVTFPTTTIQNLAAGEKRTIDVTLKPGDKAIAGDYMVTLTATGKNAGNQSVQVRVTVATPSVWGIVGIIIIIIVIAGLAYIFMRFSRR